MVEHPAFGVWLKKRRRALDLSRQALANQAGCAEITLRRIEGGTLKPSRELAALLLENVGVPKNELEIWVRFARGQSGLPIQGSSQAAVPTKTNLPTQLTSFIGREKELSETLRLLDQHRLVSLIGMGGVGKTRISIKAGENLVRNYPDGVWLAELASLADPGLIPQTIAAIFGTGLSPSLPITQVLIKFLRPKTILLILDNCEHLLDACAQLSDTFLKNCPGLKILTTSREPLGILGEASYQIPALGLPDEGKFLGVYREIESVRLFEERAQLVKTHFFLTMENASLVAQICRRLDGIPLAIELAAVQVGQLSVEEIASQLDVSFQILTGGSRTALPRQQTIRTSIDWSWNLLTDVEKKLLRRLSVFAGGWTVASAVSVCGDDTVKTLMMQLVRKSLIVVNQVPGRETRCNFHEVVRQYARERLVEAEELQILQEQHLKYFLGLSEQAEYALVGPDQMAWHIRIVDECDNLRAALNYAGQMNHTEAGLTIPGNLGRRFWESFDVREGLKWLDMFLQSPGAETYPGAMAKALAVQGGLYLAMQRFKEARKSEETALALFLAHGDIRGEIDALINLGGAMQFLEGWDRKVELQEKVLGLAQSIGDVWREARAYGALGWDHRNVEKVNDCWGKAIKLFRQVGDWRSLAFYLGLLGDWLVSIGGMRQAEGLLREANDINQRMNNRREMEFVLTSYGYLALADRDYDRAIDCFRENAKLMDIVGNRMGYLWARARLGLAVLLRGNSLEAQNILFDTLADFHEDGNTEGVVFTMSKVAGLLVSINEFEKAAQLFGWSDSKLDGVRPVLDQAVINHDIEFIQKKIGERAYQEAYGKGRSLGMNEVIALALENDQVVGGL